MFTIKIHGLPGKNPVTEQWMRELLNDLNLGQTMTSVQKYGFWQEPDLEMDLESEIAAIEKADADLIVAKSLGSYIVLKGFEKGILRAKAFVMIGVPVQSYNNQVLAILKRFCSENLALLIQKTNDPVGSFSDLKGVLDDSDICQLVEMPGDDHKYLEIEELCHFIKSWYSSIRS